MERFYMTNRGLDYVAKTASGYVLKITKGKFGDGVSNGTITELSDLVNPLGELAISKITANNGSVKIDTQFSNMVDGSILPPFYLKELGLFAKLVKDGEDDPNYPETLIAYSCTLPNEQGERIPGVLTEYIISWPYSVTNSENVEVVISSMAYVKQKEYDSYISENDKNISELQSRTNVEVVYRDETGSGEANTLCFIIDEDKPDSPESPEEINAVAFDNVAFAEEAPIDGKTENYFEVSGGSEGASGDAGKKIVMQNGKLTVLDEPDEDTVFLFDEEN